jgi:signal transduction histidine kinase
VLDLKQHLQRNIEMERLRLAQDLHDVPLQELYGVIYKLEELRTGSDADPAEVLSEVIRDIQRTLSFLRSAASELRPPALSHFGLEKAVRSYMHEFHEKNPAMRIRLLLARDNQTLPEDVRLVLFRVLQEAASNAARHAQATELRVSFNFDAEEARIEIADNGRGFAMPEDWLSMVRDGHYGLAGMAEWVSAAGGKLEVVTAPGAATAVRAVIPYTPK